MNEFSMLKSKIIILYYLRFYYIHTSVWSYACCAVHSALLVGLLKAKINGLSLFFAISLKTSGVNAPAAAEAPVWTFQFYTKIVFLWRKPAYLSRQKVWFLSQLRLMSSSLCSPLRTRSCGLPNYPRADSLQVTHQYPSSKYYCALVVECNRQLPLLWHKDQQFQ